MYEPLVWYTHSVLLMCKNVTYKLPWFAIFECSLWVGEHEHYFLFLFFIITSGKHKFNSTVLLTLQTRQWHIVIHIYYSKKCV